MGYEGMNEYQIEQKELAKMNTCSIRSNDMSFFIN